MTRKKLVLSILSLVSIFGLGLSSCNNVEAIPGEQGPIGPEGPHGEKGDDGEDGSIIHTGEGKPEDSLGKDADIYIDSKTGDLYTKVDGSWSLTMNIKGEDGKDGQDGSDGHNGSSGSDGTDGVPAYSNTILPSEDGYIVPSVGSAKVGEDVTFTFNFTNSDGGNGENVQWTFYQKNGEAITATGNNIVEPMIEGGYVVRAEVIDAQVERVDTKEQLAEELTNLEGGQHIFVIDESIELSSETFNAPETETQSISTFSNSRKNDFFKTGKIEITTKGDEPVDVEIISNGKNKEFIFPFLTIKGDNVKSFRFNNINLVCDFDLDKIGTPDDGFSNFINCSGVDELIFNNTTFRIKANDKYSPGNYLSNDIIPNFINMDGTSIKINNFKQYKDYASYSWGFIGIDSRNINLENIEINNSEIYSSVPFFFEYFHDKTSNTYELNIDVNNTQFYNCKPDCLMPFVNFYNEFEDPNDVKLDINIDVNNTDYNLYWQDDYEVYLNGAGIGVIDLTDWYCEYADNKSGEALMKLDADDLSPDYSNKINVNLHNYRENNVRVTYNEDLKVIPEFDVILSSIYDESTGQHKDNVTFNKEQHDALKGKNPRYYVDIFEIILDEDYFRVYDQYSQNTSRYPNLTIDGTNVYNN